MKKINRYKKIATLTLPRISIRWFCLLGGIILFLLLSLYVYQINAETSEKYSVQDFEEKITSISEENNSLEISSARTASLDNIAQAIKDLEFEKTDKVYYIQVMNTQVVIK